MFRSLKKKTFATLTAAALVGSVGCGSSPSEGVTPREPTTVGPTTVAQTETQAIYAGIYDSSNPINFTQDGVLPGQFSTILAGLADLGDHPGTSLLDFAQAAGLNLGALGQIVSALADDAIKTYVYKNNPTVQNIATAVAGIGQLAQNLDLHNTITVHTPKPDGEVVIEQQVARIGFSAFGVTQVVDVPSDKLLAAHSTMIGTLTPHADAPTVADADLNFTDGTFAIPIGAMLLDAAGPLIFQHIYPNANPAPQTLKDVVLLSIDCNAIGQALANAGNSLAGNNTVFTASQFAPLCVTAVSDAADYATNQIRNVALTGSKLERASVTLLDAPVGSTTTDHRSDQMVSGSANWQFTLTGAPVTVPTTFSGSRIGNAY